MTTLFVCMAVGVPVGAIIGFLGALYGSAALVGLAIGYLMLRNIIVGLIALIGVICLLPFAALPIDIGFSPTLLDLVLLALFFVWISQLSTRKETEFIAASPTLGMLVFLALAVVSFVAGLGHAPLTPNVLRHFVEILLSISLFLLVINTVRAEKQLRTVVLAFILAGFTAALIGIVLYFLPEMLTVRLLSALRVVRYPTGMDVLRYIEDDPELPLRATSTSVDPNVLGGLLVFAGAVTAAQVFARNPILPRCCSIPMFGSIFLCLLLTFSRGSFVGLGVALFLQGALRYRRMLLVGLVVLVILLVLPVSQVYVQHLIEGAQGQDLATQMRFGEYKDAFILIQRYPWFGVGFAGTPEIDTYLGVSSVYLLIAEEMGLVGLAAFLATLVGFLVSFALAWPRRVQNAPLEPTLLGICTAVAGAMVAGVLDHYLFNLDFPHAAALLWLMLGLGAVSIRLTRTPQLFETRKTA